MIIDAHTDVLWKMLNDSDISFYHDDGKLSVNYPSMVDGKISVQIFAIFVSTMKNSRFLAALQSVDDFYEKIVHTDKLVLAKSYQDIIQGLASGKKIALLSLEGADALENDLSRLRLFYRLGVRAMGLTWNYANEVADGVLEQRNAGLSEFGKSVIKEMNRLGMMIDVSHLSETGFWNVIELSQTPIMATHSNAKKICNHPRNLTDEQIKAIVKSNGVIGVTFVQAFTANRERPSTVDLLLHIDHIASLGGTKNIGLGSDFDGAKTLVGLESASDFHNLVNELQKHYSEAFIKDILQQNWLDYYRRVL